MHKKRRKKKYLCNKSTERVVKNQSNNNNNNKKRQHVDAWMDGYIKLHSRKLILEYLTHHSSRVGKFLVLQVNSSMDIHNICIIIKCVCHNGLAMCQSSKFHHIIIPTYFPITSTSAASAASSSSSCDIALQTKHFSATFSYPLSLLLLSSHRQHNRKKRIPTFNEQAHWNMIA